jgi:hypothetical protein
MKTMTTAVVLVIALGGSAYAQGTLGPSPVGNFNRACGTDVQSFCPAAQTPKDRHQCVRSNKDKLSDSCKTFLADRRAQRQQMQAAAQSGPASPPQSQESSGGKDGQ